MNKPFVKVVKSGLGVNQKGLRKAKCNGCGCEISSATHYLHTKGIQIRKQEERIKELKTHFCSHSENGSCNLAKSEVKNDTIVIDELPKFPKSDGKDTRKVRIILAKLKAKQQGIMYTEKKLTMKQALEEIERLRDLAIDWGWKIEELEAQITFSPSGKTLAKNEWKKELLKLWNKRADEDEEEGIIDFDDLLIDVELIVKTLKKKLPSKEPFIRGVGNKLNSSKAFAENENRQDLNLNFNLFNELIEIGIEIDADCNDDLIKHLVNCHKQRLKSKEAELIKNRFLEGCGKIFTFDRFKEDGTLGPESMHCEKNMKLCPECEELLKKINLFSSESGEHK